MVRNWFISVVFTCNLVLAQILAGQYEFWDYYGSHIYDYSGNGRHAEIIDSVTIPTLTDRGLYISNGYTLRFPQNSYKEFPITYTDMVLSVLFYPKTDKSFCLIKLTVGSNNLQICFISELAEIKVSVQGSFINSQQTTISFNDWKLYTIRFSQFSGSTFLYVYIDGDDTDTALTYMMNSFTFTSTNTYWELGSNSIEGFLYQIWWHSQVTISIKTLSDSMIALPSSPCITLNALTPFRRCLSNQLDKFKNSENEDCTSCIASNQSCDKDQVCIDSCQYKCISPSGCRSTSYPICSTPTPTYCSAVPGTDICLECNTGWLMSMTTPGICEITVIGCKVFDSSARCTECQAGYYITPITPTSCILCPDNCEVCTLNNSSEVVCSKCPAGQIIHTSPLCVSVCPPTFYANTLVTPNRCASCNSECKYCTYNPTLKYTVCSECLDSYFLMHYISILGPGDHSKTQCSNTCDKDYYGDSSATPPICKLCRSNCEICTNSTDCSLCKVGYMLSVDTLTCIRCVDGCRRCSSTTVCEMCDYGRYLNNDATTCLYCTPNCMTCEEDVNCQKCLDHANAFIVGDVITCRVKCNKSSYLDNTDKVCLEYSEDRLSVTYCSTDTSMITTCNNCPVADMGTESCPASICKERCKRCNTVNGVVFCSICDTPTYLQPDSITCLSTCPDFYYKNDESKVCTRCINDCKKCSDQVSCEECKTGYSLAYDSSGCYLKCPVKYYSDQTGLWRCISCIPNCDICTNSSDCQICSVNMYLVRSSTGVISCESTCPRRNYFDENRVCYYCMDNCDVCIKDTSEVLTCNICSVGYILINKECVELKCDPNCINCVISSTVLRCDLCKEGYFIDPYGYKCLSVCPDRYYGDTGTKRCTACMDNCETCQELSISTPTCTLCSPGYLIKDS